MTLPGDEVRPRSSRIQIAEIYLLCSSIAALVIALLLATLGGHFVDLMNPIEKIALSFGIAMGLIGLFGCIVAYRRIRSSRLILASILCLNALVLYINMCVVGHLWGLGQP